MREQIEQRLRDLARRAGLSALPTPVLVAALALLTVAVVAALIRWWPGPGTGSLVVEHAAAGESTAGVDAGAAAPVSTRARSTDASDEASVALGARVCVDVEGAVRRPGLLTLPAGSRIAAAVQAAGGLRPDAAGGAVNLAAKLEDGQQIVVPTKEEARAAGGASAGAASGASGSGTGATAPLGAKVDLNAADATQLDALPGIGPSTAAKIVADRAASGRFKSVDDLGRVPGIGPKKLDQLRPLVRVD